MNNTTKVKTEEEANYFAMHLLVPTKMLREEINKIGGFDPSDDRDSALRKLAAKFRVSQTIIAFRVAEEANAQADTRHE